MDNKKIARELVKLAETMVSEEAKIRDNLLDIYRIQLKNALELIRQAQTNPKSSLARLIDLCGWLNESMDREYDRLYGH